MSDFTLETGLLIPAALADEMAEKRLRDLHGHDHDHDDPDFPVSFHTHTALSQVGLGTGPSNQALLNEQQGWAAIALRAIEDRISKMDWFVAERRYDTDLQQFVYDPVPEHPLNAVLDNPNMIFSGRKLRMLISGLVCQTGVCYLQKLRDPLGVVRELWPIPTQQCEPISADNKLIGAYRVRSEDGREYHLHPDEVIRIWRPDLLTVYGSLGVLGTQAIVYDALKFMSQHLRAHYENDATPKVALIGEPGANAPDPKSMRKFLHAWRVAHNRVKGVELGLPAFIPSGFKVHEFTNVDAAEAEVSQERAWARQILASYGVPMFAVGIDTNVNRATGETTMWAWDQNGIQPLTALIADDLTTQLAQPDFFQDLAVRFPDFVTSDKEFDLRQEDQDLRHGTRSIQQVRKGRKLNPDDAPWGELPRGTLAEVPYTGEEPDEPDDDDIETVQDLRGDGGAGGTGGDQPAVLREGPDRDFFSSDRSWARLRAVEKRFAAVFATAQMRVWDAQRREMRRLLALVSGVEEDDLRLMIDGNAKERRAASRRVGNDWNRAISVDEIFLAAGPWMEIYDEIVTPIREEILEAAAAETLGALAPGTDFVLSGFVETQLATQGAVYVQLVDNTTRNRLARILAETVPAGESISGLARRLDVVFQDIKRSRTVARTEVGMANQIGVIEGFDQSNVVEQKMWNDSRTRVRDSHQIQGQVRALNAPFLLNSGVLAMHPLERGLPPEEVINCRCFVTPVIAGDPVDAG